MFETTNQCCIGSLETPRNHTIFRYRSPMAHSDLSHKVHLSFPAASASGRRPVVPAPVVAAPRPAKLSHGMLWKCVDSWIILDLLIFWIEKNIILGFLRISSLPSGNLTAIENGFLECDFP